ncbi:MAG: SBBP repeat-containing protein [Bacteroidales bacterium]|nr:SBBP repeat-containing protein [Bacteroidales bacterium]
MKKQLSILVFGILLSQGILKSQTSEDADSAVFTLGFSTYLSHTDKYASGFDIYTDSEGYAYISGNTRDKNFPATEGAYQTELKGSADVFVAKYTPEGEIVFATLLGGTEREHHSAITADDQGFIYVAGGTESPDFPVTEKAFDTSFNGARSWGGDVFVTKLNPNGTEIIFSTFIGGEVEETIGSGGIKVDSEGNVIIAGTTKSNNFPLTKGSIDNNDNMHGFLSKLSSDGDKLLFSRFFGSSPREGISGVDIDDKDNIYISGITYTADLAVTDNAFRKEILMPASGGLMDHYIAKIDETGNKILYLSYFATDGYLGSPIAWTSPNRLTVCGGTSAENFPVTDNAIGKKVKGNQDAYISVFNSETMRLEYASLFGGSEEERVKSAHFIDEHTVAIGGTTSSADYPITGNALYSEFPVCEKSFNSSFLGRKKSFVTVIDTKSSKLLYSSYFGSSFIFHIYPDKNGNLSFVAEAGQRGEAGITGFPVTKNAVEPPTYTMVGRLLLNAKPEPTKEELYKDVSVENAILVSYVGRYEMNPGFIFSVIKNDSQLIWQIPGQGGAPKQEVSIFPKSQNEFYVKGSVYEISFIINEAGEVESMALQGDGGDPVICKKLED